MSTAHWRSLASRLRRRWSIVRVNWRDIWRPTREMLLWDRPVRRAVMLALGGLGVLFAIHDLVAGKPWLILGFLMLLTPVLGLILALMALASVFGSKPANEDDLIELASLILTFTIMYFVVWSAGRIVWSITRFIDFAIVGAVVLALFAHAIFYVVVPGRTRLCHDALDVLGGLLVVSPFLATAYYFGDADREATIAFVSAIALGLVTRRDTVARLGLTLFVALLAALAWVSPRALELIPVRAVRKYGCNALLWALRSASRGEPRRMHALVDALGPQLPLHAVRLLQVRAIQGALRAHTYAAIGARSLPLLGLRDPCEPRWLSTLVAAGQLHAELRGSPPGARREALREELEQLLEDGHITLNRELQSPAPCPSAVEAFTLLGDWIAAVRAVGAAR